MKPLLSDYARQQRLRAVLPFVRGDVLDVGCGYTFLPDYLTARQRYVGVDIHPAILARNARRYPQHTFYRRDLDAEDLALAEQPFDTATMIAVIEHLRFPERVLRQVRSHLSPDGLLLITTPSPWGDAIHRLGGRLRLFYSEAQVKHVRIFRRSDLVGLVGRCGYEVQQASHFLLAMNQLLVCRPVARQED